MDQEHSVASQHAHTPVLPDAFLALQSLVVKTGTESQKQFVEIAGGYIIALNNMFNEREVDEFMLKEFDLPMFINELKHGGRLEGKSRPEVMMLIMNVRHIVRHTWEMTGKDGKIRTGNDLRKAWPLMWEDDAALTLDQLFRDVQTM